MRHTNVGSHRRWRPLLALSVPVLALVALLTMRRRPAPEPAEAHRDDPRISARHNRELELDMLQRATPSTEPTRSTEQPAAAPPAAEAVRARPHDPATQGPDHGDEPLRDGATQAEIEAYMAKAKVLHTEPSQAAADERDHHVGELAGSGPGGTEWVKHFEQVENDWLTIDNREGFGIEFTGWQCFKKGCTTTMRAPSAETLERFSSFVFNGKTTREWRGAGFCSGPIRTDTGEIESTWIFYAPTS